MSLFDVIKYGNIDIESENDLNRLPPEVVKKWHARVVEHACQSAESIAHQDKSGKSQELIDFTRKFIRGEVDNKTLSTILTVVDAAHNGAYNPVSDAAIYAAKSAYYAFTAAGYASAGAYHASGASTNPSSEMDKEWLTEELMNFEEIE